MEIIKLIVTIVIIIIIILPYRPDEMDDDDKFRMKKKAAGALLKVKVFSCFSTTLSNVTVDNATMGRYSETSKDLVALVDIVDF